MAKPEEKKFEPIDVRRLFAEVGPNRAVYMIRKQAEEGDIVAACMFRDIMTRWAIEALHSTEHEAYPLLAGVQSGNEMEMASKVLKMVEKGFTRVEEIKLVEEFESKWEKTLSEKWGKEAKLPRTVEELLKPK